MPRASREDAYKLAKLSSDCSFLLTHMIRQNCKPPRTDEEARNILFSILGLDNPLSKPELKGGPVGWYSSCPSTYIYNPENNDFSGKCNTQAVCFTESTLTGLRAHRDIFKVKYGVAFDRDYLFNRGANPCLNIRGDIWKAELGKNPRNKGLVVSYGPQYLNLYHFIPSQLHPFINIINSSFDATHEREWRFCGDMSFEYDNLMFIFCPDYEFKYFCNIQKSGRPTLFDLMWLDKL